MDLFGDLPAAKNATKDESTDMDSQFAANVSKNQTLETKTTKPSPRVILPQAPKPAEKESKKGPSVMAFIPAAARARRRMEPRRNNLPNVSVVPKPGLSADSVVTTTYIQTSHQSETSTDQSQNQNQSIHVHETPSESSSLQEGNESMQQRQQEWIEPEELRLLHEKALEDPYDPMVPNDLLQYWERKSFEKERIQLEKERQLAIEQQEFLREQLQRERMELAQSGNVQQFLEHQQHRSRGRGRGVSNIPAWLVEKQKRQAAMDEAIQPSKKPKN